MSWLSGYKDNRKRYKQAFKELEERGEVDLSNLTRVLYIQTMLIFGILSYLLPLLSINSELQWIFEYPELATSFKLYMAVVGGMFVFMFILETKLNRQIDKKVYDYMKQQGAKK